MRKKASIQKSFAILVLAAGCLWFAHDKASALMGSSAEPIGVSTDTGSVTDSRVQSDVMQALSAEPTFQKEGVSADVRSGVVYLKGQVSSLRIKQLASEIARNAGAVQIRNEITV